MLLAKVLSRTLVVASLAAVSANAQTATSEGARDPVPEPPKLVPQESPGIVRQAGVGGDVAYARAGVVELGGTAMLTTGEDDFVQVGVAPSVGYFLSDNLQISGIASWNYAEANNANGIHSGSVLVEPSFHLPLTNTQFVFAGLGFGALFQTDIDTGAALAPRVGFKNLVGRSGMLTISLQGVYGLNDTDIQSARGETVVGVSSAYNVGVGYTVLL